MRAALVSMVLFPLAGIIGCGELMVDDSLMVCVEPDNCSCCEDPCSNGEYPANATLPIAVVIQANEAEIKQFKCEVEVSGEFELTVHAQWRELDKDDDAPETVMDCGKSPELAPGTWTLIHGENSEELVIPSSAPDADLPVCVSPFS